MYEKVGLEALASCLPAIGVVWGPDFAHAHEKPFRHLRTGEVEAVADLLENLVHVVILNF